MKRRSPLPPSPAPSTAPPAPLPADSASSPPCPPPSSAGSLARAALRVGPAAALMLAGLATALSLLPGGLSPARGAPAAAAPEGSWETWANGDRVLALAADPDGAWLGTEAGGLVRWTAADGGYRQHLAPQDEIPGNTVHDLLDAGEAVWLATDRGLARFRPSSESWTTWTPASSPGMPHGPVTALAAAGDGTLWVGFAQRWDPEADPPEGAEASGPGGFVGGGIARFDPGSGAWSERERARRADPVPGQEGRPDFVSLPSDNVTVLAVGGDGALWVGTRPFVIWDPGDCVEGTCEGSWILDGGGIAARHQGTWRRWRKTAEPLTSCYPTYVSDLVAETGPGAEGRAWVATRGEGVLLMMGGAQPHSCESGQVYYGVQRRQGQTQIPGLRGRMAFSVGVDELGRVWIGHGEDLETGQGIALLDHKGTFEDSSASPTPWVTDDEWRFFDLGDQPGESDLLVSAMDVSRPGARAFGTRDEARGDGGGLWLLDDALPDPDPESPDPEAAPRWRVLRTADSGLPSNRITSIRVDPRTGDRWFATEFRGLARRDAETGVWEHHRAYADEPGAAIARVIAPAAREADRVKVDIDGVAAFQLLFPEPASRRFVRFGDDDTVYRVNRFIEQRGEIGPFLEVQPVLRDAWDTGTPIHRVERGPAGERATSLAFDAEGRAWAGAFKSRWQVARDGRCPDYPDCWIDGGAARLGADGWSIFDPSNSGFDDRDIADVEVDEAGFVWLAQSDLSSAGHGIGMYDPESGQWVQHRATADLNSGNGPSDLAIDPQKGDLWASFIPIEDLVQIPGGPPQRIFAGGGVARWDGLRWRAWTKADRNSTLRAFGEKGSLYAVLPDRERNRIWAGGWDAVQKQFHWPTGIGVHAVLNYCPIDGCDDNDWQHVEWSGEGQVNALAQDEAGRVWAGLSRFGYGLVPARGGVRVFDGETWQALDPASSGVPGREISALAPEGAAMWVGTMADGAARFQPALGPTPTPSPSAIVTAGATEPTPPTASTPSSPTPSSPTPSATPSQTPGGTEPTPPTPGSPTATPATPAPETPTPTDEPSPTSPPPSPSPAACGPDGLCRLYLPVGLRPR